MTSICLNYAINKQYQGLFCVLCTLLCLATHWKIFMCTTIIENTVVKRCIKCQLYLLTSRAESFSRSSARPQTSGIPRSVIVRTGTCHWSVADPKKQSFNHYAHYFKLHFLLPRLLWYEVDNNSGALLINIKQHSLEFLHNINTSGIHAFEKIRYVSFDHIIYVWSWGGYLSVLGKLLVSSSRWNTVPVNLVALRQISYPQLAMRSNGLKTGNLTSLSRPNYMHWSRKDWARDEWRK